MNIMRVLKRSVWMLCAAFVFVMSACDHHTVDSGLQQQKDIATIDEYLAQNHIDAIKDKGGVRYSFDSLGTGFPPRPDEAIKVKYVGKYLDGTVFDPGAEITGVLNTFIEGWVAGLAVWPAGSKGRLFIPSPMGYSTAGYGSVPPNAILAFDITLEQVIYSNAAKARLAADITTIDQYLADHKIDAVKDSTGIRYVITNQGSGTPPTWYTKVKFSSVGKQLSNGNEFYRGSVAPNDIYDSRVVDYLHCLKFGLMKIGAGGSITVYAPSGLAFGPYTDNSTSLPINSIVIYDINLEEIVAD
jgi:FKBP-type peptidyl-prolyl cis-trans isomerase FkpA